jgi:leucyl aminopeptidase (aminopeptidase T)
MFDVNKLFSDVFHPEPGERLVILADVPHDGIEDNDLWVERRNMAAEWHASLFDYGTESGFEVAPLTLFPAVGTHNGDLPLDERNPEGLSNALSNATIAVAMTEFSPTAPMVAWARAHDDFRAATLPGVARRTEATALSADYSEVARRCLILRDLLASADSADVTFTSGHNWHVDLRHHTALTDDGQLPRGKPDPVINLPSGETFQVPYEGELEGDPSLTSGEVPVQVGHRDRVGDEMIVYRVEANRIVDVVGGKQADGSRAYFERDPSRGNIAEFAFGCNPEAVVWGNVLEDEKAGFHWAYGRSEPLGGSVGPSSFKSPETIVHEDIVYAKDSPIQVRSAVLNAINGEQIEVIRDGDYLVFQE